MGDRSIVSRLLLTNELPLDAEARFLRGTLLEKFEGELEIVEARREELLTTIHQLKAILSPVRRVPPEIWAEIFRLNPESCSVFDTKSKAWCLSQVSRLFRATALSCPELWSDMHLSSLYTRSRSDDHLLALARTVLQRAGTGLIDLEFWAHGSIEPELLKLFLPRANSWRKLEFCSWTTTLEPLAQVQHQLSNLQSVKFSSCDDSFSICIAEWKDVFRNCSQLHEVSGPFSILGAVNLPWSQITHCTLDDFDSDDHVKLLRLAPKLQVFEAGHNYILGAPSDSKIVHSGIRELTVQDARTLQRLMLPNLETLEVNSSQNGRPEYIVPDFHEFIVRSMCFLRSLHIIDHHMNDGLLETLEHLFTLEELKFYFRNFYEEDLEWTEEMFRLMFVVPPSHNGIQVEDGPANVDVGGESGDDKDEDNEECANILLPKLEVLEIMIEGRGVDGRGLRLWDYQLVSMVRSRRSGILPKGVSRFKKLSLRRYQLFGLMEHQMRSLLDLQTAGLALELYDDGDFSFQLSPVAEILTQLQTEICAQRP
ncbi:hypothetical protein C8J56DRAFT_1021103 [Mycena floridula]|nr:hypothetical protein C8J56DRAFT_1021103 [Mycena floridula]